MATKTIAWNSGSGNITVTYDGSGDGTAVITSSDNDLYEERSQQITFQTTEGSPQVTRTVTITQAAKINYATRYFTFVPLEASTFTFAAHGSGNDIQYSIDEGSTWVSLASGTASPSVSAGSKIMWKSTRTPSNESGNYGVGTFSSTGRFNVEGNAMSLLYGDDFTDKTSLSGKNGALGTLFEGCTNLVGASNMMLPAVRLVSYCYYGMFKDCTSLTTSPYIAPIISLGGSSCRCMFQGCTSLTTVPQLTVTTVVGSCYASMFEGCTSLVTAPELPATTLASTCYASMFNGCTSLVTAPELPATTLANECYCRMFYGCRSLNYIKCLATDISATNCTYNWVNNVAANGTFVKNAEMDSWARGASGIPNNWVAVNEHEDEYLTIVSKADNNTIGWKASDASILRTISISTDDGQTWVSKESSTTGTELATLDNGDKLLIKGSNNSYGTGNYYNYFTSTQIFDAQGNIMSLIYGDNFIGQTSLSGKGYAFRYLFYQTSVVNAQNLKLPATTLAGSCYQNMFNGCSSLVTVPNDLLPATTLTSYCYTSMFKDCTSLTTAPSLPATTLSTSCYNNMFSGCTSLTAAPVELPVTTLAQYCYYNMFQGCISLEVAPELPATTLANSCYAGMFQGCTSLTTAPELSATTLASGCYTGMFQGCTSLTTAPELSATTLAQQCYYNMFNGCTSLTIAPALPATTLQPTCYREMFRGCISLTTAPELPATTLVSYCYTSMFNGCTSLNYIKCLATDISASNCTYYWLYGVAATGTFVKNANMTGWTTGNNGIPTGWTVVDAS